MSGLAEVSDYGTEAMEAANPSNGTAVRIGGLHGGRPRPAAEHPGAPAAGPRGDPKGRSAEL